MMIRRCFLLLFIALSYVSIGQPLNFHRVFLDFNSVGIRINTNGWGINYRKGRCINRFYRKYYEVEFTRIKDTRAIKFSNPYYITPENIYFGKVNDFFDIHLSYGHQRILVEKKDKGSLEIRLCSSFGPALGISKPVYYNVVDRTGSYTYFTKFTDDLLLQQILSMAPFNKGLDEMKPNIGANGKIGISFERSKREKTLSAMEIGSTFTIYLLPIELVYKRKQNFFFNLYLEYRIGKFFPTKLRHKENETNEQ